MNARCRQSTDDSGENTDLHDVPDALSALLRGRTSTAALPASGISVATFCGFDLEDRPLLAGIPGMAQELVVARSTVPLQNEMKGASVVIVHSDFNPMQPIVIGVLQDKPFREPIKAQVDGEVLVLEAQREIVLRCGAASITLTRAGKVLIAGSYVLSRSSGCNRIKGAAIDIN